MPEPTKDTTPTTLPEDNKFPEVTKSTEDVKPDGDGAVEGGDVSLKETLGKELGKEFESDEAALKAVKDTFKFVGKREEDIIREYEERKAQQPNNAGDPETPDNNEPPVDPNKFVSRDEFDEAMFFKDNPEYESHRDLLKGLRKEGQTLEDVANNEAFQTIYKKAKAYDEAESSKSILHSNPRLGKAQDKITEAKQAVKDGKQIEGEDKAVDAVVDAYLKGDK